MKPDRLMNCTPYFGGLDKGYFRTFTKMATNRKPNYNRNNKESTPRGSRHLLFQFNIPLIYIWCSFKWISGQNDFKLVWFVFPFFKEHGNNRPTNQASLKSFWPEIHFKLQHIRRWPVLDSLSVGKIEKEDERLDRPWSRSSPARSFDRPHPRVSNSPYIRMLRMSSCMEDCIDLLSPSNVITGFACSSSC